MVDFIVHLVLKQREHDIFTSYNISKKIFCILVNKGECECIDTNDIFYDIQIDIFSDKNIKEVGKTMFECTSKDIVGKISYINFNTTLAILNEHKSITKIVHLIEKFDGNIDYYFFNNKDELLDILSDFKDLTPLQLIED